MMIEYWIEVTRKVLLSFGVLAIFASFYISRGKKPPWQDSKMSRSVLFGGLCLVISGNLLGGLLRLLNW